MRVNDKDYLLHGDFETWLQQPKNLKNLSDEIGANWALVKRFLTVTLLESGFYVLSKKEIEELKKGGDMSE